MYIYVCSIHISCFAQRSVSWLSADYQLYTDNTRASHGRTTKECQEVVSRLTLIIMFMFRRKRTMCGIRRKNFSRYIILGPNLDLSFPRYIPLGGRVVIRVYILPYVLLYVCVCVCVCCLCVYVVCVCMCV